MKLVLLEAKVSENLTMKGDSTYVDIGTGKEPSISSDGMKDFSKVVDEVLEAENGQVPVMHEGYLVDGDDANLSRVVDEQKQSPILPEFDCEKEIRGCEGEKGPDYWSDSEVHKPYTV
ncbi:Hypothetical predicted protein [Olea europaea subsp. europaea]|uniref:Uncharacterized protein n=1 Tax=Olea europaea subsp. europaea TaxID=158383 RepID=A0A8S0Q2W4_OLEEU|nr:Hypothetical predicted protein [Olea europaea subsp. europaea]